MNLVIGLFTTITAVVILGSIVFFNEGFKSMPTQQFLQNILPRVTLAVFIEIVSFFFLNLYKRTLEDIKYFQNERTNINSKVTSLRMALYTNDSEMIKNVMNSFSTVERNFIIKKGESTILLENNIEENKSYNDSIDKLSGFLDKLKELKA